MKVIIRITLVSALIFLINSCSTRDYHLFRLSESMTTSNQIKHIEAIQEIDSKLDNKVFRDSYCRSYNLGYGGFTLSCNM